jgi:nucleotide-binding universal stress UspA family protein
MNKRMRILIAYDGSEPSKHALNQGVSLASLTDSDITILSVVPNIMIPIYSEEGLEVSPASSAQEMVGYQEELKKHYSNNIAKASDEIAGTYPGIKVETMLLDGKPSQTIVDVAKEGVFDLIVIGSRGIGGITG